MTYKKLLERLEPRGLDIFSSRGILRLKIAGEFLLWKNVYDYRFYTNQDVADYLDLFPELNAEFIRQKALTKNKPSV